jgi:hypothetical protein
LAWRITGDVITAVICKPFKKPIPKTPQYALLSALRKNNSWQNNKNYNKN